MIVRVKLSILALLVLMGCEKAFMQEEPGNNPEEIFKTLWKDVDRKYAFFEYKNVDWDSVRSVYKPKIHKGMSDRELFDVLAEMLNTLKDGHVNLISDFDQSRYWKWYLDYPQNFDYSLLERHYLKDDYRITDDFRILYRKFDSVGYMYVPSFNASNPGVIDEVMTTFKDAKGIIVDVRDNGGGSINLAESLAGKFTDQKRKYAYWQWKNGPEHDDFTKQIPQFIKPEGDYQFTGPVAVLVNRSSYSATNDFALAMNELPHATLIGDTTGGGGGIPHRNELPNGWTYRLSKTKTYSSEFNNVEDGLAPDIDIDMQEGDDKQDEILERALTFIRDQ